MSFAEHSLLWTCSGHQAKASRAWRERDAAEFWNYRTCRWPRAMNVRNSVCWTSRVNFHELEITSEGVKHLIFFWPFATNHVFIFSLSMLSLQLLSWAPFCTFFNTSFRTSQYKAPSRCWFWCLPLKLCRRQRRLVHLSNWRKTDFRPA